MMAASSASRGGKRILAQLEHGARPVAKPPRASWTIDGWTVGLCVLLLLMCSVAWMMHEKTITPSSFKRSESRSRAHAVTPRVDTSATAQPELAAAIVNESPLADQAPASGMPQTFPAPAPSKGRQASAQPWHTQVPAGAGNAARTTQPAIAQKAVATRNANTTPAAAPAPRDTDVALLTALVAHANKPTVTIAERSRDVVERREGDSTAQLLARCQQLGLIEGMLCRSRICSGRWEADAACRAPAH
jgi:hypothetical protein